MSPVPSFRFPFRWPSAALRRARRVLRQHHVGAAVLAAVLGLSGPQCSAATDTALAEGIMLNLVSLASARLAAAKSSAQWQWQHHQNVTRDAAADGVLLASLNKIAPQYGLDPLFAKIFFDDQNAAARQLQSALVAAWKTGPAPDKIDPSAFESAREETYRISQGMLPALVRVAPLRASDECPIVLSRALTRWTTQMAKLDSSERDALRAALKNVCAGGGIGGTA